MEEQLMSGSPITRDDAVLALRLWGLASRRYTTPSVLPLHGPEPVSLYAGFEAMGQDPIDALDGLVDVLQELSLEWTTWADENTPSWPFRDDGPLRLCPEPGATVPS
jgi:hypothetical protein